MERASYFILHSILFIFLSSFSSLHSVFFSLMREKNAEREESKELHSSLSSLHSSLSSLHSSLFSFFALFFPLSLHSSLSSFFFLVYSVFSLFLLLSLMREKNEMSEQQIERKMKWEKNEVGEE